MKRLIVLFLIISTISCIQEFDENIEEGPKRLVVEGSITTESGPYLVRLSQSERFDFFFTNVDEGTVSNAIIIISDDEGNSETLEEIKTGIYSTNPDGTGIQGVVGRKYQLSITTQNGTFYQSTPQEILPVANLTSVSFTIDSKPKVVFPPAGLAPPSKTINLDPNTNRSSWLNQPLENPGNFISVPEELLGEPAFLLGSFPLPMNNASFVRLPGEVVSNLVISNQVIKLGFSMNDTPGERNFYRWSGRVTFGVSSNPELFTLRSIRGRNILYVNIPKSCCNQCYVSFEIPTVTIGNDRFKDGGKISGEIGEISVNNFYFNQQLYAEVVQSSLSFEAYKFFDSIDRQATEVGSIFDSSPELLISNMVNMDDPDNVVLGYFWASDVKVKGQFIPISLGNSSFVFSDDCRTLTNNLMVSTTVKPAFWPN